MKIETGTGCKLYTLNEFELEQHDAEIKTPLEEEIERLKQYVIDINKDNNRLREKLNVTVKDHFDPTTWEKQARQKVIAELEKWVEANKFFCYNTVGDTTIFQLYADSLKQKLKEMKEKE